MRDTSNQVLSDDDLGIPIDSSVTYPLVDQERQTSKGTSTKTRRQSLLHALPNSSEASIPDNRSGV